jgi:hypothetical protein
MGSGLRASSGGHMLLYHLPVLAMSLKCLKEPDVFNEGPSTIFVVAFTFLAEKITFLSIADVCSLSLSLMSLSPFWQMTPNLQRFEGLRVIQDHSCLGYLLQILDIVVFLLKALRLV